MYTLFSKNINRQNTHWNWNDNKIGSKSSKCVHGWFGIHCFQLKAIHLILRIIKHSTFSIKVLVSKPFHLIKGLQGIYILLILMHFIVVCKINILKHKNKKFLKRSWRLLNSTEHPLLKTNFNTMNQAHSHNALERKTADSI